MVTIHQKQQYATAAIYPCVSVTNVKERPYEHLETYKIKIYRVVCYIICLFLVVD